MASRAACRAKRRTNPSREEAAPRAFSSGAASDLSGSLEESVAMDALEWPRRAAGSFLLFQFLFLCYFSRPSRQHFERFRKILHMASLLFLLLEIYAGFEALVPRNG